MPILELEIVCRDREDSASQAKLQELADAAGRIFETPPGRTWVKAYELPVERYAENDCPLPDDARPVMATILKAKLPKGAALQDEIAKLSAAIAEILERPKENVHIKYEPEGAGRIAFGGNLIQ